MNANNSKSSKLNLMEEVFNLPLYKEHKALSSYAIMREYCKNSDGEQIKIQIDEELRYRYLKAYEAQLSICVNPSYPGYEKMISQNLERIVLESKRLDGIRFMLVYTSEAVGIELSYEPVFTKDKEGETVLMISTMIDDNKLPKTYVIGNITLTPWCSQMLKEWDAIQTRLGIPYDSLSLGAIIPRRTDDK